jgi:hypothetical protein
MLRHSSSQFNSQIFQQGPRGEVASATGCKRYATLTIR